MPPSESSTSNLAGKMAINIMPTGPLEEIVALAQLAERLGYERCWVYDEGLHTHDVYVTLSAIAVATDRIKLGPGITNPFVRHPGATATALASLDQLSGGRAFLGLGAGGSLTLGPLGIERTKPITAMEEMVDCLRRLFAGETVTHSGHAFSFDRASLSYGRSDLEIMLAGRGPRVSALGADEADGFVLSYIHKELLAEHAARLRDRAGDRPFTVTYSTKIVTTDAEVVAAREQLTFRLVDSPGDLRERIGLTDVVVDSIRQALAEGGPSKAAAFIDPAWVEQFVLVGSIEECRREVAELLTQTGIDQFQLPVHPGAASAGLIEGFAPVET